MTKDEALRMTFEALKELKAVMPIFPKDGDCIIGYKDRYNAAQYQASNAIAAAKQALEPPAKPWVGLTNEEVKAIFDSVPTSSCQSYDHWRSLVAIGIEAKLKEKNNG